MSSFTHIYSSILRKNIKAGVAMDQWGLIEGIHTPYDVTKALNISVVHNGRPDNEVQVGLLDVSGGASKNPRSYSWSKKVQPPTSKCRQSKLGDSKDGREPVLFRLKRSI